MRERRDACLAAPLFSHSIAGFLESTSSTPGCVRCLSPFCACGVCASAGAPGNQVCSPIAVLSVFCRARSSPGREGTGSFTTLLFGLRPYSFLLPVLLPSVLLTQNSSNEVVHFSCFHSCGRCFSSAFLSSPLGSSDSSIRPPMSAKAQDW